MHDMLPLLQNSSFPKLRRRSVSTLQLNLGYQCNQTCQHCHVNAGPNRTEMLDADTAALAVQAIESLGVTQLDLTGGAPEMNPLFRDLVTKVRQKGCKVIDRCNLSILFEEGQEGLAEFLATQQVEVVASLPCYLGTNVDSQRGKGVFDLSIKGLRKLNELGYGTEGSGLVLNLVYNPLGAQLPPDQRILEDSYRRELSQYGIRFNQLLTITNMPIARFGSTLVSKGEFTGYMELLRDSFNHGNLTNVMCLDLVSVDYQGYLYDCDFNQMLAMGINRDQKQLHLKDLLNTPLDQHEILVADHCYGCTAGSGSSCGGALS